MNADHRLVQPAGEHVMASARLSGGRLSGAAPNFVA